MKNNNEKSYIGIPIPLIVFVVILLEIFAVGGIKSFDVRKNGDISNQISVTETTTEKDIDKGSKIYEKSTERYTDEECNNALSVKEGLLHKAKEPWKQPETCTNVEQYAKVVNDYILSGSDEELIIYTEGFSDEDFDKIANYYMTQPFGWLGSLSWQSGENSGEKKVTQTLKFDESYYVYRYIVYGDSIPKNETKALELYDAIEKMLQDVDLLNMNDYQKELYFHDYIIKLTEYDYGALGTKGRTESHSAYGVFINKKSVCDGYTRAMGLLLSIAGIENYYVSGLINDDIESVGDNKAHAWNMVKIEDNWFLVDATWDDGKGDVVNHIYFNVDDEIMNRSRKAYHSELYPECTSMLMNYYVENNMYLNSYEDYKAYISNFSGITDKTEIEVVVSDYDEDKYNFSEIHQILNIPNMRYSVNEIADSYVVIILYTY